jgi:hypothetical protein
MSNIVFVWTILQTHYYFLTANHNQRKSTSTNLHITDGYTGIYTWWHTGDSMIEYLLQCGTGTHLVDYYVPVLEGRTFRLPGTKTLDQAYPATGTRYYIMVVRSTWYIRYIPVIRNGSYHNTISLFMQHPHGRKRRQLPSFSSEVGIVPTRVPWVQGWIIPSPVSWR